MTAILIVSPHKDFAQGLSDQLREQLGLACEIVDDIRAAQEILTPDISLLIAHEAPLVSLGPPTLVISPDKKPHSMRAILADVKQLTSGAAEDDALSIGSDYQFHPRQKQLIAVASGKTVDVTDKESQLLQCLIAGGDDGVARDDLLRQVWGFEAVLDTHTLETHVYRLRGKFRELDDTQPIVATDSGYKLEMLS